MLLKISSSSSSGLSIPFPFSNSTSFHIVIPDQRENTIHFKTFLTDSLVWTDKVMANTTNPLHGYFTNVQSTLGR
jgi:hypothetical protein